MDSLKNQILEIIDRSDYVPDWPADERRAHRDYTGDFTSRRRFVQSLRVLKILDLTRPAGRTIGIDVIAEVLSHRDPEGGDRELRARDLMAAASCYLDAAQYGREGWQHPDGRLAAPGGWPWSEDRWEPSSDRSENLAIAGAIVAEAINVMAGAHTPHWRIRKMADYEPNPWVVEHIAGASEHFGDDHEYGSFPTHAEALGAAERWHSTECS